MAYSRQIAGLAGPTMMALGASEALNFHIWAAVDPAVVYLNGTLLFVAGLAIVRVHNVWTMRWPVLVTLTGWILALGGLYRMFAPEAPQAPESVLTYVMFAALLAVGCIVTYNAYRPAGGVE